MWVSTRTPEGQDNVCPVCGAQVRIEPSSPIRDAPCPKCGNLLRFPLIRDEDEDLVLHLEGGREIEQEAVDLVRRLIRSAETRGLILDLRYVRSLSSNSLGNLIGLKKLASSTRRKLRLRNVSPDLLEVLRITRLDQIFEILEA